MCMISIESMAITKDATQGGMSARSALAMLSTALRSLHLRKAQMSKRIEVKSGDRYERLTIVEEADGGTLPSGKNYRRVTCRCECGTVVTVELRSVVKRRTRSCGCLQRELASAKMTAMLTTHASTGTRTHNRWLSMIRRCSIPSDTAYVNYGERGIAVCCRWTDSFEAFLEDMGECPSDDHSIERRDNDGNYEPGNCEWATRKEQARNRRSSRIVTFNGASMCLATLADVCGVPYKTLHRRLSRGLTVEDAVTRPLRERRAAK